MPNRWIVPLLTIALAAPLLAQEQKAPDFATPKVAPAALEADKPAATDASAEAARALPGVDPEDAELAGAKPRVIERGPVPTGKGFFGAGTDLYTLTLDEAIRTALVHNLDARVEKAGIAIEDARVRNAYGEFDPVFSFSIVRSKTQTPDDRQNISSADAVAQLQAIEAQINAINQNTLANQQFTNAILEALGRPTQQFDTEPLLFDATGRDRIIFEQESDRGEIALQARTPLGTVLRASARVTKFRSTFEGDERNPEPSYIANTQLEFRQPLLKDFGFSANLADLRISRKNREAQELTWKFRLEATLQNVVATYYDMIFGLSDLKNKGDAITEGLKLVAFSQRRQELGFFSPYEVKQAQVQLSFDRENLFIAKNVFLERQYVMKRLVLPAFETKDRQVYLPKEVPALRVPPLNRDALLAVAYQNRYDYKAAILGAEAEDVRLKFARNQMYPQLDVVGSYGWSGLDSSYPSAVGQMMESQATQWQIGITGGFPLGGIQPRAQLDAAKARKEQAILRVKTSELEVGLGVERAIELIRTNQQRLETARFTTRVAADAVRVGLRRMEEGLISNFDLIEQQRRLYEARTRELASVAELNKSVTQLWLATGTVLENLNISIGMVRGDGKTVQKVKTTVTTTTTAPKAKRKR
jgi:outer membrane protein